MEDALIELSCAEIVQSARSVVVAGGTMQPIDEFKQQLFIAAGADARRISEFSCEHVVPGDHLLPVVMCTGPTGVQLDFSFQHRDNPKLLGKILLNVKLFSLVKYPINFIMSHCWRHTKIIVLNSRMNMKQSNSVENSLYKLVFNLLVKLSVFNNI